MAFIAANLKKTTPSQLQDIQERYTYQSTDSFDDILSEGYFLGAFDCSACFVVVDVTAGVGWLTIVVDSDTGTSTNQSGMPAAADVVVKSQTLADAVAYAESGLPVNGVVTTIEYNSGTGIGGNTYQKLDAGSSGARPAADGGSVIHLTGGSGGLYLQGHFPDVKVCASKFGLQPGEPGSAIMQKAIDYCATQFSSTLILPNLESPAEIDDDIFYRQNTRIEGYGFDRLFVEDVAAGAAFVRTVANKGFVIDGDLQGERLRWCTMNYISVDGGGLAGDIVKIRKVQNFRQRGCQISNTPDRTMHISDIYDSWFEESYYQRAGTTGGVSESFHLDDSLGTAISHNNNIRFKGCTWEGNYGVPLLISGAGTGVGNSQIVFTNKCKLENLEADDYQLKVFDSGSITFDSLLVVSKGTAATTIDAQMYFENVKNVRGSFDVAHSSGGAALNSVIKLNGYSRSVFELYPAEANVIDGLVGSNIFDNSTGAYDSRTELVCVYMGSKSLVTNNTTNDRFQPLGIDVSGPVGLRLRRNGATNANNLIHHDGGTNGDIYHGINASGEFVVSTSSDPSGSQIFKVDRNGTPSSGATQLTVGAAGGASALPALPSGYVKIKTTSGDKVIPFFNVS